MRQEQLGNLLEAGGAQIKMVKKQVLIFLDIFHLKEHSLVSYTPTYGENSFSFENINLDILNTSLFLPPVYEYLQILLIKIGGDEEGYGIFISNLERRWDVYTKLHQCYLIQQSQSVTSTHINNNFNLSSIAFDIPFCCCWYKLSL